MAYWCLLCALVLSDTGFLATLLVANMGHLGESGAVRAVRGYLRAHHATLLCRLTVYLTHVFSFLSFW
jgi:hypothetical protein